MRAAALGTPERLWRELSGDKAQRELQILWLKAGHGVEPRLEMPEPFRVDHFPEDLGEGWEVRIVQMPAPERPAEAYAAAVVYQAPGSSWLFFKRPATMRYFTMERGFDPDGTGVLPVAAEWTRKGARRRIGVVERLSNEAFLLEIAKTLFGM